jgi:hypothetical protein
VGAHQALHVQQPAAVAGVAGAAPPQWQVAEVRPQQGAQTPAVQRGEGVAGAARALDLDGLRAAVGLAIMALENGGGRNR